MHRRKSLQGWSIAIVLLGLSLWSLCNAEAKGCIKSLIYENDKILLTMRIIR